MYNFLCLAHLCSELAAFAFWTPTISCPHSPSCHQSGFALFVWVYHTCFLFQHCLLLRPITFIQTRAGWRKFISLSICPDQYWAYPASSSVDITGCETDQLLPSNVKFTNEWSYTYTLPCAFITFRQTTLPGLHSCVCLVVLFLVFLIKLKPNVTF